MARPDENVLGRILEAKAEELKRLRSALGKQGLVRLRSQAERSVRPSDFLSALTQSPRTAVIAEFKRRSPSAGEINAADDPAERAEIYRQAGAAAVSVLTDGRFFGGSLEDLTAAAKASGLPVLRKDFIIDPLQIHQAVTAGASAVLLIAAALDGANLRDLYQEALSLGLAALVEVHHEDELEKVMALRPPVVGVNNRNLSDMSVDLGTCVRIRKLIPSKVTVVAESGVRDAEDIWRLKKEGLDAFLVGSALMRSGDPLALLNSMTSVEGEV